MKAGRFHYLLAAWVAATALSIGCLHAAAGEAPAAASTEDDPAFPKPAANGDRYILGPGDVIEVFVWRSPELSKTMPVLPDGTISTPLVDGIVASGKTPVMLARDVEAALSEYVRSPKVSVLVSMPKSSFRQVKVLGEVVSPRPLAYQDGMTVMDALLEWGGLGPFASGNKAKILRKVGGKEQEIPVKLKNLEKGDMKQNLPLQPGDILVVPKTFM